MRGIGGVAEINLLPACLAGSAYVAFDIVRVQSIPNSKESSSRYRRRHSDPAVLTPF
jgi:hypothetical protein